MELVAGGRAGASKVVRSSGKGLPGGAAEGAGSSSQMQGGGSGAGGGLGVFVHHEDQRLHALDRRPHFPAPGQHDDGYGRIVAQDPATRSGVPSAV
jgi:hypothetical protein